MCWQSGREERFAGLKRKNNKFWCKNCKISNVRPELQIFVQRTFLESFGIVIGGISQ